MFTIVLGLQQDSYHDSYQQNAQLVGKMITTNSSSIALVTLFNELSSEKIKSVVIFEDNQGTINV